MSAVKRLSKKAAKTAVGLYRGYMPENLPQHQPPNRIKPWWKVLGKPRVTIYPKEEVEPYSKVPEYPPILDDGSKESIRSRIRHEWYDSLKALPTVEEKIHEIVRHPAHYIGHINNWLPIAHSLPMIQYMTHTHIIPTLPDTYNVASSPDASEIERGGKDTSDFIEQLQSIILNQIALDKHDTSKISRQYISKSIRDGSRESYKSSTLIQNIASQAKKAMALESNQQLLDYQYDLSPAIRTWLYHSGFKAPNNKPFYKSRKDANGNINQIIQVDGSAALSLRAESFIEPIVNWNDTLVTDTSLVKEHNYPLKDYQARFKFKWPVALAGFWYEEQPKFDMPHTCFLTTDCLDLRNTHYHNYARPLDDKEDCLNGQAILTAFAWLNSLSMYHGFTPFHEITYPFTCQVITTDGQDWLFNIYQLNSQTFHRDLGGPSKNNLCWSSGLMKLYESYEDGQFKGVNTEVIKLVSRFMSQQTNPSYTNSLELRPYLGADTRTDEEKNTMAALVRKCYEGRTNQFHSVDWYVPLFEHIFFRSKVARGRITHMKPKYHHPKPEIPKIFE